jgi:hypothetical protein
VICTTKSASRHLSPSVSRQPWSLTCPSVQSLANPVKTLSATSCVRVVCPLPGRRYPMPGKQGRLLRAERALGSGPSWRDVQSGTRKCHNQTIHGPFHNAHGYSILNCSSAKTAESLASVLVLQRCAHIGALWSPLICSVLDRAMRCPNRISCKDVETRWLQYQVILGRYHGEVAKQKGSGTILPLWNQTGALS